MGSGIGDSSWCQEMFQYSGWASRREESGIVRGNNTGRQPSTQSLSDLSFGTIL